MKYWETNSFKALEKDWEEKLKQSGFKDAEETIKGEKLLIQQSSNVYRQAVPLIRESKMDYYQLIMVNLADNPPEDEVELLVMTRLSEGKKIGDISTELATLGERCHRQTIRFIKRKYEDQWNIKKWEPHQLRSRKM